jgi:hypothetical protein
VAIDLPTGRPTPKWARTLVAAAKTRNRIRAPNAPTDYSIDDLIWAWNLCGGCCQVSGLPFSLEVVGNGQAKRPFAPSLDRIDRHQPYTKGNVRLVVAIANFAMNAWGEQPLFQLSTAVHAKRGTQLVGEKTGPGDADLDNVAMLEAELADTDSGILPFPPRPDLYQPILDILQGGEKSSRFIEKALANQFSIPKEARMAGLLSVPGYPAWRNHVAWALGDLGTGKRGTRQIERVGSGPAPCGGSTGIYRLLDPQ